MRSLRSNVPAAAINDILIMGPPPVDPASAAVAAAGAGPLQSRTGYVETLPIHLGHGATPAGLEAYSAGDPAKRAT